MPTGWQIINGYLVGPEADLSNANLSGVNLSNANLSGVKLSGSILSNANLEGVNLNGANLSLANLDNANLRGSDLSQTNLSFTNLRNADLTDAKITEPDRARLNEQINDQIISIIQTDFVPLDHGVAYYNAATILPVGFSAVSAGWFLANY